jgi:hypothetical protein
MRTFWFLTVGLGQFASQFTVRRVYGSKEACFVLRSCDVMFHGCFFESISRVQEPSLVFRKCTCVHFLLLAPTIQL